jgi:predicted RNase H-like nuclease
VHVVGIDGTKGGWVAVALDEDGRFAADFVLRPVESVGELAEAYVIAVDVPIGYGPREADVAARGFMRGAASTVFPTPTRAVLDLPFEPGLGVSAQSHALGPRIIHITELAARDRPDLRGASGGLVQGARQRSGIRGHSPRRRTHVPRRNAPRGHGRVPLHTGG